MKKIVVASALAMAVLALSGAQADAWTNSRFSIGLDWHRQTGGNSFCWGLIYNGQPPTSQAPYVNRPYSYPNYSYAPAWSYVPYSANFAPPSEPAYATPPSINYDSPYQYANYPHPAYYYPNVWYGR